MRKSSKFLGAIAGAGLLLTAAVTPAMADVVDSTVSGGALTVTSAAPTMSGVTLDGKTTQTSTGTSAAWSITDARGTGAAWAVSASATDFTSAIGSADLVVRTIAVAGLTITPGTITAGTGADSATSITGSTLTMSTTDQALISATGPNKGTYSVAPSFSLDIPANAYRSNYITGSTGAMNPYTSTITYTMA